MNRMTLPANPDAWGLCQGYWDVSGHWHDVPGETTASVLASMGADAPAPPFAAPLITVDEDGPLPALPEGKLDLEGGGSVAAGGSREVGRLPLGYHRFQSADGVQSLSIAVCPSRCPAPPPARSWGWAVQLYSARSNASWGIGDFADLRRLVHWAGGSGASFVLLNPLHAPAPGPVPEPSPYFPSSRCFINPLYINVEDVPGAAGDAGTSDLGQKARALNNERLIDRARVWALKSEALERLFMCFEENEDPRFEAYLQRAGAILDNYTSFCALADVHGVPWQHWPEQLRRPDGPGLAAFASSEEGRARKRYHGWLQWLCEAQLGAATEGTGVRLMCDLAVGADGCGADAWLWQDVFALDMRVGAPPDDFNPAGQDWGLPPWDPWRLRAVGYEPYLETLRAVLRPAGALRVDHVMGLFRLFWVPLGEEPSVGTYVRYPWEDMVRLLRLEAVRAGACVVGEDLGTVEDYVREVLAGSGVMSYKLFWFEPQPPREWPAQALGAVTTHDLPTVAGVWTGADVAAQRRIGMAVNEESSAALRSRLSEWTGSGDDRPLDEVISATYEALSEAPCSFLVAGLEDALAVEERPNMPGTIAQWPNWCLSLPLPLEELEQNQLAAAIARHLSGAGG